ncbi:hypothetical protein BCR32DRAFT_290057 [Anaeromyces robustus]|uniref:Uncharacterized protein n=1 Tax=Anaeromyces robustus TaxID=1754192 RepID=A0A1Y1XKN8_9FUNG|nr:hypothetical protein BCR32DRAFT_290057 [Anaeromyces robustus]|eukprot:ORX86327.1 hypothetical protein BCR32DRAFT_290057 [Anaeromyces robustus]
MDTDLNIDVDELDKFFEESPLFEKDREIEKRKLLEEKIANEILNDEIFRCKICKTYNVEMRRLPICRSDEGPTLILLDFIGNVWRLWTLNLCGLMIKSLKSLWMIWKIGYIQSHFD